jgi:hypothetical protein
LPATVVMMPAGLTFADTAAETIGDIDIPRCVSATPVGAESPALAAGPSSPGVVHCPQNC